MKNLCLLSLGVLAAIELLSGCGRGGLALDPQTSLASMGGDAFAADSVPNPPHPSPPPPRPVIVPVQFVNADSTLAGTTGISRWILGNDSPRPFAMNWTVVGDSTWSAFPITGTLLLDRRSTAPLEVPIPVPAGAAEGVYPLLMRVQTPDGGSASASGTIRVFRADSLTAR